MKRLTALMAVAALVVGSAMVFAQAKPNFAGKWTLDPAVAPAAGNGAPGGGRGGRGGGLGQELTITQDATTLTLEYVGGGRNPGPMKLAYRLDGSESKNPGMGGQEQVSKAAWQGDHLVVTTQLNFGGNSVEQKRTFSLEGGNLVIESVNPGREGGAGTPMKMTYKKAS